MAAGCHAVYRSENGEIVVKEQMQSEYWTIKYYSLLISISCFLVTSSWNDRASLLRAKAEVTVQPPWVPPNTTTFTKGSFYAVVEVGCSEVGEDVIYTVRLDDGSTQQVPRHQLRHRVWHYVAFLGITNEKQHVAITTQAFHTRQLEFWRRWNDTGRNAALAYAAQDPAGVPGTFENSVEATEEWAKTMAASVAANDDPAFAQFISQLEHEQFDAYIGHRDNATHFKSSGNLHWWSLQRESLGFIKNIRIEFGCPGRGKGPWDGLGAVAKTRVKNDIINLISSKLRTTPSGRITTPLEVAQHLRSVFTNSKWLQRHANMKINEVVVMYIDKTEFVWPPDEGPKYGTLHGISSLYSFFCRGSGGGTGEARVAGRRWLCWCEACYAAFETGIGMDLTTLAVTGCKRSHLDVHFKESIIKCTASSGIANAKARQKALWKSLKPLLHEGKLAAVQARELWSTEEQVHMRPGHFWVCELGNFDGCGSPIIHTYTKKNEVFTLSNGQKHRGDEGDCLLLLRRYYHRVADDPKGLTFVREVRDGEILVVISTELRAVQGRQACDMQLAPICMHCKPGKPCQRCAVGGARWAGMRQSRQGPSVEAYFHPNQRWALDAELDSDIRALCDGT